MVMLFQHGDILVSPCGLESGHRAGNTLGWCKTHRLNSRACHPPQRHEEESRPVLVQDSQTVLTGRCWTGGRAVWLSQPPQCVKPCASSCQIKNKKSYLPPADCTEAKGSIAWHRPALCPRHMPGPVLCERPGSHLPFPNSVFETVKPYLALPVPLHIYFLSSGELMIDVRKSGQSTLRTRAQLLRRPWVTLVLKGMRVRMY